MSRSTRSFLLASLLASSQVFAEAPAAPGAGVSDTSYALPGGERVIELSIVVPAPLADTWQLFATSDGYRSWAAPVATVDTRIGGVIETSYDPAAVLGAPGNIRNEIVALVPLRLLVIRNTQAPLKTPFDVPTFQRLQTALQFSSVGPNQTRVTLQCGGILQGDKFDGVYDFFKAGNIWTLEKLRERIEKGPTAWTAPPIATTATTPAN